jgi:hypothetical protein
MASAVDVGLAPLILPDQSLHCLDVVFIHGLNGQRARSWTNSSSELWPLWFIDDLPGARAWTYGYDAGIAVSSRDGMNLHSVRFLSALVEKGIGKSVGSPKLSVSQWLLTGVRPARTTQTPSFQSYSWLIVLEEF